jgi:hypothetical protein
MTLGHSSTVRMRKYWQKIKYGLINTITKTNTNSTQPLRTVRPIYRMGIPLSSRCCIFYIFSTNISTEYFKQAAHSPFFS